jgi:hypothetical protein
MERERVGTGLGYRMASVLALAAAPVIWSIQPVGGSAEDVNTAARLLRMVFGFGEALPGV